jgi:hypothetical protein
MFRPRGLEVTLLLVTLGFRFNDISYTFDSVHYFVEAAQIFHYGKDANYYKAMVCLFLSTLSVYSLKDRTRFLL